jgi:hypothetical protein
LSELVHQDWIPVSALKKKRTLTPLLVIVFLASYGLMTMLIVEQGETITSQAGFIKVLLGDSRELWAIKGKTQVERAARALADAQAPSQNQAPVKQLPPMQGQVPSAQTPSTHAPLTQTPLTRVPSSQLPPNRIPSNQVQQHQLPNRAGTKPENRIPQTQVPPMPASDLGDQRRVLRTL